MGLIPNVLQGQESLTILLWVLRRYRVRQARFGGGSIQSGLGFFRRLFAQPTVEHKRSIGSPATLSLGEGSRSSFTAEDLATTVLSSMRADLSRALGHDAR